MARQRHSARQAQATLVLSELEELALLDLARETERLRTALARSAPSRSKDDAAENGELSRARMAATDALELWSKVHAACTLARLEASAGRQQEEQEAEQAQSEGAEEEGDGEHHHAEQRHKDRKHWEHDG